MKLASPLDGQVVRVLDNIAHQLLRVHDLVLIRHHPPRDSQDGPKHSDIKQHGPSWGDFEMEECVRVDEGEENEDRGEGPGEERDEARDEGCLLLGILIDVLIRDGVGPVEALEEEVRELVELAELPAGEGCKLTRAD
jgi:hypothetical protein